MAGRRTWAPSRSSSRLGSSSIRVFNAAGQPLGDIGGISVVFGVALNDRDELFAAARNQNQIVKFRVKE